MTSPALARIGAVIEKGWFDELGIPTNWAIEPGTANHILGLMSDGTVLVNGVEIVEWTRERRAAMAKKEPK